MGNCDQFFAKAKYVNVQNNLTRKILPLRKKKAKTAKKIQAYHRNPLISQEVISLHATELTVSAIPSTEDEHTEWLSSV